MPEIANILEEIKTDSKNGTDDLTLEERLRRQTETKAPPKTSSNAPKKEETKSFWDETDEDFDYPEEEEKIKPDDKKPEAPKDKKLTKQLFEGSATSFAGFVDTISQWTFTAIHNYKFKKKYEKRFTDLERKQLEDKIAEAEAEDLEDDEDKKLKKRFEKLLKVIDAKKAAVPMTEKERKDFEESLICVMEARQKALPPELWAGAQFVNILSKRIIDITME